MLRRIRAAVLVSGGGTNLQAIIDASAAGKIRHAELSLVAASNPDAFALVRAERANIPTAVVARKSYADAASFERELLRVLDEHGIELIVLAGFMTILSADFIRHYENRIINVHPSLIPSFCGKGFYGLRVHEAALDYGVKVTGATVHFVNEIPDGGAIIAQKSVAIRKNDTPETLQRRVMEQAEWKLLPRALELVALELAKSEQK